MPTLTALRNRGIVDAGGPPVAGVEVEVEGDGVARGEPDVVGHRVEVDVLGADIGDVVAGPVQRAADQRLGRGGVGWRCWGCRSPTSGRLPRPSNYGFGFHLTAWALKLSSMNGPVPTGSVMVIRGLVDPIGNATGLRM